METFWKSRHWPDKVFSTLYECKNECAKKINKDHQAEVFHILDLRLTAPYLWNIEMYMSDMKKALEKLAALHEDLGDGKFEERNGIIQYGPITH